MLVPGAYTDITTIVHNDTPIQFGRAADGSIQYSVLLADASDERGTWKDVGVLTFPTEYQPVASTTRTAFPSSLTPANAPPQVVSDGKYVYVFRVFSDDTIYVDRFIPDIVNAVLHQAFEVRTREDGSYGYTDLNNDPFYAPTIQLTMLNKVANGTFAVLQVPTSRPGVNRWQFFILISDGSIRSVSIRCSPEGLFDLKDQTISYSPTDRQGNPLKPQMLTVPGIADTMFRGDGATVSSGLAAARFQKHDEATDSKGNPTLVRTYVHVMLAFRTSASNQIGVVDFEVGKDGLLADPHHDVPLRVLAGPPWTMRAGPPDHRGLVCASGLLPFASTLDTPFILDSGDGFVHLYLRGVANEYLVAFYDTLHLAWIDQTDPNIAQVKNAGDWIGPGLKTAIQDSELLLFAPGGYQIWQYDPLITGTLDGNRHVDQGFPGRAVVDGVHVEYFTDQRLGGLGERPALVGWLGAGRVLFISQGGGYQIWQYDPTVPAGTRDGYHGQSNMPGQVVVSGIHSQYFGEYVGTRDRSADLLINLEQGRILFVSQDGPYAVWQYDASVTGFRDGYAGQDFPGTIVVTGTGPGFFTSNRGVDGPPVAATSLGQNRFLLINAQGAYEVWQYDPTAQGNREGVLNQGQGFPGTLVVSGTGSGFIEGESFNPGTPLIAVPLGPNRFLLLGSGGIYQVWTYDPTAQGFRDGARTGVQFPGTLVVTGTGPGFFDGPNYTAGKDPILACSLGFSSIGSRPGVIEQGAVATHDDGSLIQDAQGNLQGALYRWYTSLSHGTAASAARIKVEDLQLAFVGTNLVDASLAGYIEGAPPIPVENIADLSDVPSDSYNRVTLTVAEDKQNVWTWDRDTGLDMKAEMSAGGSGFGWKVTGTVSVDTSYGFLDGRQESSDFQLVTTRVSAVEGAISGNTWTPYNYGIAFLTGLQANVYALRLQGSERVVGYQQVVSNENMVQEEVRFLLNPFYTKQGTLDGMIGLTPDSSYPNAKNVRIGNSYFKPDEAKAFAAAIEREAQVREAFYTQYNANAFNSLSDDDKSGMTQRSLVASYQWQAPGGLNIQSEQITNVSQTSAGGSFKFLGMVGATAEYEPPADTPGASFKASVMFGGHLQLTVKKANQATMSYGLNAQISIPHDVVNAPPGTKVQSYEFQTFYLAEDLSHFHDFFGRVVDTAWLNGQDSASSNDQKTIATLLGVMNRPKAAWRVLHRVTSLDRGDGPVVSGT